jgi:hypothetical protein
VAASAAPFVTPSHAAELAPGTAGTVLAQQWRAVSRIGYGPSELLLAELRAAHNPDRHGLRVASAAQRLARQTVAPLLASSARRCGLS